MLSNLAKRALQELMKVGWIEQQEKPELYTQLLINIELVNDYLSVFDLVVRIDETRGLIYILVQFSSRNQVYESVEDNSLEKVEPSIMEQDEWSHPFVRRQRLTLEQSLLLAILRQRFVEVEQKQGIGHHEIYADLDDLSSQFFVYLQSSGSERKDEEKIIVLLKQLAEHGVVGKVNEQGRVLIRPLIAHLANPESLALFLMQLTELKSVAVE